MDTEQLKPRPRRLRIWPALRTLLRTRIFAGVATIIPLWVTWVVLTFLFNAMRSITQPIIERGIRWMTHSTGDELPGLPAYVDWVVPLIAVLLMLFCLYVLGLVTANVIGRRVVLFLERVFAGLPLVKTIYGSTKRIVVAFAGKSGSPGPQKVVLVEFPRPGMKCIAFLTSIIKDADTERELATIFVPTTPNPTTGYMQVLPLEHLSDTGWTVEEAIKVLMSGGILSPPTVRFDCVHPVNASAVVPTTPPC